LRLLRYYKLAFATVWRDPALRLLLIATLVILGIGTLAYRIAEDWGWIGSFYFCVITLTTIGYGDLSPTSDFTRLFTVLYAFLGIGIFATFITVLVRAPMMEERRRLGEDSTPNQTTLVLPQRPHERRNPWRTAPLRNRR
jgi:voltage-gated potassium channel